MVDVIVIVIVNVGKYNLFIIFPYVAYQLQNKRCWRHRNFAEVLRTTMTKT